MLCRIADLTVEVPAAGGMSSRCGGYRLDGTHRPDITIFEDYHPDAWPNLRPELVAYMESGYRFYRAILGFGGLMLHASALAMDGRAYLVSAPSGTGKTTHGRLWQSVYGQAVTVFNDDKPALRRINGQWLAYGTPWCGKDGINVNMSAPLAGICMLRRGDENRIRRLTAVEAVQAILGQTTYRVCGEEMERLLRQIDALVREIPVFELCCRPDEEAARLCHSTMLKTAEELGL